jgi:hypothetical protein
VTRPNPALPLSPPEIPQDLTCPVCSYSLHALTTHRCPECGSPFNLELLLNRHAARHHSYLFEHGPAPTPKRWFWTLQRSLLFLTGRRLWRRIDPAHEISVPRLFLYLLLNQLLAFTLSAIGFILVIQFLANSWDSWLVRGNLWTLLTYGVSSAAESWPVFLWPLLMFLSLRLFLESMRQSQIRQAQLWRCIVYANDAVLCWGLLVGIIKAAHELSHSFFGNHAYHFRPDFVLCPMLFLSLACLRCLGADVWYLKVPSVKWDFLLALIVSGLATVLLFALTTRWAIELFKAF